MVGGEEIPLDFGILEDTHVQDRNLCLYTQASSNLMFHNVLHSKETHVV